MSGRPRYAGARGRSRPRPDAGPDAGAEADAEAVSDAVSVHPAKITAPVPGCRRGTRAAAVRGVMLAAMTTHSHIRMGVPSAQGEC